MRTFCSFLLILFFPSFLIAQNDEHRLSIRGDFEAVHASASKLFTDKMNGVIGGDLSLQIPLAGSFFTAVGGNYTQFEQAGDPTNLLHDETMLYMYGPFLKAGYRPYVSRATYVELSVKGGYRFLTFDAPRCQQKGRKSIHSSSGFSMTPKLGFWWDTGDGLHFGAVVAHELLGDRFDTDLICEDISSDAPENESRYRMWHFGFAFSADLVSSN